MAQRDLSGSAHQSFGQPARLEALADRARVSRLVLEHRCAQRLQPLDPLVELLDDHLLEDWIPSRTLGPEALECPMAPDDAAREQHRTTRAVAFLEHERLRTEFPGPRRRRQPGHPGSRDAEASLRDAALRIRGLCPWIRLK